MKVCENLKLVMQRCKVALLSEDIDDPSAVLMCTAAGSILVYSSPQSCYIYLYGPMRELL